MTSRLAPDAGDHGAQVQVLADEVRAYLMLHGGALDEHDEPALERFTEVFLLPAFAAVWEQGRQAPITPSTVQADTHSPGPSSSPAADGSAGSPVTSSPVSPAGVAANPYATPRLLRRTLWWHRLLNTPPDAPRPARRRGRLQRPQH